MLSVACLAGGETVMQQLYGAYLASKVGPFAARLLNDFIMGSAAFCVVMGSANLIRQANKAENDLKQHL
jgi:hypothetical protein